MDIIALIPAYNPGAGDILISIVRELVDSPVRAIVVVDDGSSPPFAPLFEAISRLPGVTVIRHGSNRGKGAALKTGFRHIQSLPTPPKGVITLDADGQHLVSDALGVAEELERNPARLILGVRKLTRDIPLRSYIGNTLTRFLYRRLIGQDVADTQTGLRGIPTCCLPQFLKLGSDGYEFELDMLLMCKHSSIPLVQHSIATRYENGNAGSHFNPIRDSLKIYFVLLRFTLTSISTAAIDYLVFWTTYQLLESVVLCTAAARVCAVIYNYGLVKRFVFYSNQRHSVTLPRYILLVICLGTISVSLIKTLMALFNIPVLPAKAIVESSIFLANFFIQRDLIFTRRPRVCDTPGEEKAVISAEESF